MTSLIDVHVHLAAFPDGRNGCFMSPTFQKGILVKLVKWKLGIKGKTAKEMNESYVSKLLKDIHNSQRVNKVVLLALDGVYDESGNLDEEKTHMMISNDAALDVVENYPDTFYLGASVNPQRKDALDELDRVIAKGAKLIKVLPNSQIFDPLNDKYIPFFKKLADTKIPLLSHIGYEYSVTAGKQEYGFPDRLKMALDEGVIVIGAHACSSAIFKQGRFYDMMLDLVERYPNFYMDLSAITLPNRAAMAYRLRHHPDLFDRLIFGSDYPLSAYATPFLGRINFFQQLRLWRTKNIFDKQAMVLESLGIEVNPDVTNKLLKLS